MPEFLLAILLTIGGFFIAAGYAVGGSVASSLDFTAARACLVIGFAVVISSATYFVWTYDPWSTITKAIWLTIFGALSLSPLFLSLVWVNGQEVARLPQLFPGIASDPPLPEGCKVSAGALKVFLGSNVAWSTRFPHSVLEMRGDQMLVIDRGSKGNLIISLLRIFNERDEIIARIDGGTIWNSDGIRAIRPDKSTLVVYDKADKEILRVVYLNRQTVKITGLFRHPPTPQIVIDDVFMTIRGNTMKAFCFGDSAVSYSIG